MKWIFGFAYSTFFLFLKKILFQELLFMGLFKSWLILVNYTVEKKKIHAKNGVSGI